MGQSCNPIALRLGSRFWSNRFYNRPSGFVGRIYEEREISKILYKLQYSPAGKKLGLLLNHVHYYPTLGNNIRPLAVVYFRFESINNSKSNRVLKKYPLDAVVRNALIRLLESRLFSLGKFWNIDIKFLKHTPFSAPILTFLFGRMLSGQRRRGASPAAITKRPMAILEKSNVFGGMSIVFRGRFSRNPRAGKDQFGFGSLKRSSFSHGLDYDFIPVRLRNGLCAIKVWVSQPAVEGQKSFEGLKRIRWLPKYY